MSKYKNTTVAIEGDKVEEALQGQGIEILEEGEGDSLGTRPLAKWAVIRCTPAEKALEIAEGQPIYPAQQGLFGWHYTRHSMDPEKLREKLQQK